MEQGHGFGSLRLRVKRWEFLAAIPAAFYALACGQEPPGAGTGGTNAPSGGVSGAGGAAGSGGANAPATPSGGTMATSGATSGGNGGSVSGSAASSGAGAKGGSGTVSIWDFACSEPSLPKDTGAWARSADFSANSETGASEPHVLYLNGYFLIRSTRQYVTEGEADHQHEILLTDEQIGALMTGNSVVVETNGPPLNASSGHSHTITIRSCFIV